jgi:predicted nucleic acid-binding protein
MILLDTSFIVAFYNTRDENHQKAVRVMEEIVKEKYGEVLITDYIFDESITVIFIRLKSLSKAVKIGEAIIKSAEIVEIGKSLFDKAWKMFKRQKKTKFSFTDCTTIAVMEDKSIKNIATFDEDFKKIKWINVVE